MLEREDFSDHFAVSRLHKEGHRLDVELGSKPLLPMRLEYHDTVNGFNFELHSSRWGEFLHVRWIKSSASQWYTLRVKRSKGAA